MKNSKFVPLYETIYNRYKQGNGFLEGDVVKLKDGYKTTEGYKQLPQTIKQRIEDIANSGLNLRLGRLHTPDAQYGSYGHLNLPATHADLYQEVAPGSFANLVTVPLEVIEAIDTGVSLAPISSKNKGDSSSSAYLKPTKKSNRKNAETDEQTKVSEEQTLAKKGDYDLPTKNSSKLPGSNKYNDDAPSKFKPLPKNKNKPKTLKENMETLEGLYVEILTEDDTSAEMEMEVSEDDDKLIFGKKDGVDAPSEPAATHTDLPAPQDLEGMEDGQVIELFKAVQKNTPGEAFKTKLKDYEGKVKEYSPELHSRVKAILKPGTAPSA